MSAIKREEYVRRRQAWAWALCDVAKAIKKDSPLQEKDPLYEILGSVAWGRYDGEPALGEVKENIVFGLGFLEGVRYAALNAGRALNLKGTRHLERIHDLVRERMK